MIENYKIVVDSREKCGLWTEKDGAIVKKLDTGDYSISGEEKNISIERKSLVDLFSTIGQGHDRFKRELERAEDMEFFAIVIEGSLSSCLNKTFPGSHYSRMKGHVVFSIMCTLLMKYGVLFFFTNGRAESKSLIRGLFNAYWKTKN